MNVKRITLNVNDGTKKGTKIAFEPKCDTYVAQHRGIKRINSYDSMVSQMMPNGREILVILSAPPDIMEILKPIIDSTVKGLING